jgi:hypothetical protein
MEIPTVRMADFEKEGYVSRREPCVITDGLAACEDLSRWTPEHLANTCGDVRVSVAVSFDGSGWRPSSTQRKRAYSFASVPLRDAVRWITRGGNGDREFYVPQEPIEKFQPLCQDVTFGKSLKESKVVLWMGTANTVSILHHDMAPNLFAQVHGEKRFILYSPDQVQLLYPQSGKQAHVSAVDVLRPDLTSCPKFADARPVAVTVTAGQILFMPAFWWHHVTSLSVSISISQWWRTDLEDYCNRTAARLMTEEYLLDGWSGMMRQRDMQLGDLLAFAERAAAVDQTMAGLALCVVLDRYDRWPDHDESTPPVEADVRQGVERVRQAVLEGEAYAISGDTIARLVRRVRDESVLGAFARGSTVPTAAFG